jgi:GT2 family glycosyltransferase
MAERQSKWYRPDRRQYGFVPIATDLDQTPPALHCRWPTKACTRAHHLEPAMPETPLRLAIGIPTRARAAILADCLADLPRQTRAADRILVCGSQAEDLAGIDAFPGIETLLAPPGLPRQRNAILDRLADCDAVLFLDDDFLMAPDYVAATVAALQAHPDLMVTTGTLIADDTRGPGLSPAQGRALIEAGARTPHDPGLDRAPHGYGCNMAIRLAPVRQHGVRFDERLPLYAWSEDVDFTHRLARHGWIAKLRGARGVHLGTKHGRTPGHRLGYSQVANPIYLFRKGSYSLGRTARSVGRNIAANVLRAPRPEPYVDRRGRLCGNAVAMLDLLRGRLAPERILEL